uniref:Large ribosomal subunit protein bL19m n=1 Tax=Apteryx owenii TaxID=8824 RepID=A0A8B9Q5K3_APTOW
MAAACGRLWERPAAALAGLAAARPAAPRSKDGLARPGPHPLPPGPRPGRALQGPGAGLGGAGEGRDQFCLKTGGVIYLFIYPFIYLFIHLFILSLQGVFLSRGTEVTAMGSQRNLSRLQSLSLLTSRSSRWRGGSILAVTTADPYANGKASRFVGICIQRGGKGLGATFVLRNVIEDQGVEICYELYNPRIQEIKVLKLEKRLDDNLMYLRDALPEYSTFDMNMKPESRLDHEEIPVNKLQVRMKPKPWSKRWERPKYNIKGIKFELPEEKMKEAQKWNKPWLEFDMLREYDTSKIEEKIWKEVNEELKK